MLKLLDAKEHYKTAHLDVNDNPVKIVCDHLRLKHYVVEDTYVVATFIRHDPISNTDLQPLTQFLIKDEAYEYLIREEGSKKKYNFRVSDIEETIIKFGDFPGANFKDKLELVK